MAPGAVYPLRVEVFLDGPGNVAESILECFCRFTVPNVYIFAYSCMFTIDISLIYIHMIHIRFSCSCT